MDGVHVYYYKDLKSVVRCPWGKCELGDSIYMTRYHVSPSFFSIFIFTLHLRVSPYHTQSLPLFNLINFLTLQK